MVQVKALSSLLDSDEQSKESVKEITEQISEIFSKACEVTFPKKRSKPTNKHKPWFGPICKSARKNTIWQENTINITKHTTTEQF